MAEELRVLRHDRNPQRRNPGRPKPAGSPADPPQQLDAAAADMYRLTVSRLAGTKILTAADSDLIALYAATLAQYYDALSKIQSFGLLIRGRHNTIVRNPAITTAHRCVEVLISLGDRLGLSPGARQRLHVPAPPVRHGDAWAELAAAPPPVPLSH